MHGPAKLLAVQPLDVSPTRGVNDMVWMSGGTFRIQIDDILASRDKVVVLCAQSAQRGTRRWSSPQVEVWTVRDGRISRFNMYVDTAKVLEAMKPAGPLQVLSDHATTSK